MHSVTGFHEIGDPLLYLSEPLKGFWGLGLARKLGYPYGILGGPAEF